MTKYALLFVLLVACSDDPGLASPDTARVDVSSDAATVIEEMGVEADGGQTAAPDMMTPDLDRDDDLGEPPLVPGWQTREPLPGAQQEVAVVALDGLVYVMGGFGETASQLATVVVYDPEADSWSSRADFPTTANHMNAAVLNGQIWVTGFYTMGFLPDERTFIYDPDTDVWSPGPDLPVERGASAIGVIDGQIYVAGGGTRSGIVARLEVLDPQTGVWTLLPDAPRAFDHAGYGVVDGKLIVAGGRNGAISSHFSDVQIFDPAAGAWTTGAPIPTGRGGVASAVHDGTLYVFGGEGDPNSPGRVFPQVEAYDVAADTWVELDPMPSPRHGFGGATIGDVIYLPGGAPTEFLDAVATHEIFIP